MKNLKLTETAARYGMTAASFEKLLSEIGWVTLGQVAESAVLKGYLTENRELTPVGDCFLMGYFVGRG